MKREHALPIILVLVAVVAGLAVGRILYELLFPTAAWLAGPVPAGLISVATVVVGWLYWRKTADDRVSMPLRPPRQHTE